MKLNKSLILFFLTLFVTFSCTIENRKHLDGYQVNTLFKKRNTQINREKNITVESRNSLRDNIPSSKDNFDNQEQSEKIIGIHKSSRLSNSEFKIKKEHFENLSLEFKNDSSVSDTANNAPNKKVEALNEETKLKNRKSTTNSYISFFSVLAMLTVLLSAILAILGLGENSSFIENFLEENIYLLTLLGFLLFILSAFTGIKTGYNSMKIEKELGQKNNNYKRALFGKIFSIALIVLVTIAIIIAIIIGIWYLMNMGPMD